MIVEAVWPEGLAEAPGPLARSLELGAFLVFAGTSVVLAVIDVVTHRLPRIVVLGSGVLVAMLLIGSAASSGQWSRVVQALLGATVLFLGYLALAMIAPTAVGGGDVRLAALIGLTLGWVGWGALVVGAFAGFVLGGLWAIGLLVQRGRARSAHVAYGPFMLAGSWLGICFGELSARWVLGGSV